MQRYSLALAACALLAALALRKGFALVTVTGDSMMPTLTPGDRVLVRRARVGQLRPGQVVVAEMPGVDGYRTAPPRGLAARREWMIKRVTALPGDPRPEDSLPATADPAGTLVPPGMFVVRGDNAAWSHDSRQIGYVPAERLLGVVVRRIHAEPITTAAEEIRRSFRRETLDQLQGKLDDQAQHQDPRSVITGLSGQQART
jgi:signal peptidase I